MFGSPVIGEWWPVTNAVIQDKPAYLNTHVDEVVHLTILQQDLKPREGSEKGRNRRALHRAVCITNADQIFTWFQNTSYDVRPTHVVKKCIFLQNDVPTCLLESSQPIEMQISSENDGNIVASNGSGWFEKFAQPNTTLEVTC